MNIPQDPDRELAVLGGMLDWPANVPVVLDVLDAADFYVPSHRSMFSALRTEYLEGHAITVSGITDAMRRLGESDTSVVDRAALAAERWVEPAIRVVATMALRRRLLNEASELSAAAQDPTIEPVDTLEKSRTALSSIDTPLLVREPDDETFDEFLSRSSAAPTPWLLWGLIREGWRTVVVAPEGRGKTVLLRQTAVCAAYGIHPFRPEPQRVIPTLLIDLENPEDHIHASLDRLVRQAKMTTARREVTPAGRLWSRPGGIDLRKRSDRAELETLIAKRRPELVVAGPLYKLTRPTQSDNWETAAREVQGVFDDWRARYGISLFLEDHAGQPVGGGRRELRPYGSSLWLRWPEIGLALEPNPNDGSLDVSRWRGDRMPTDWPDRLERSDVWPWRGVWENGMQEMPI